MERVKHTAETLAKAFGYLTIKEVRALKTLAAACKGLKPIAINVGAGSGTSSLAFREGNDALEIYTVDISPGGPYGGLENERQIFEDAGLRVPHQILSDSGDAAKIWGNGKPSLIFIDDGHDAADIIRDIESWFPHLRDFGFIAFHDYGSNNWPDVKKVVDSYNFGKPYLKIDTVIAFQKLPKGYKKPRQKR